ncbi:TPA: virulence RhuM family protein, partial [Candidatus Scatenecus faecavium]|nr:virulence RhuM family protein [Candidatus Scatenecus faecavium]
VTIDDVKIAKNYLTKIELQRLNLLVSQFLDYAELQALEQRPMKMSDWVEELDKQILLNKRKILVNNGNISHEEAIKKAEKENKK